MIMGYGLVEVPVHSEQDIAVELFFSSQRLAIIGYSPHHWQALAQMGFCI